MIFISLGPLSIYYGSCLILLYPWGLHIYNNMCFSLFSRSFQSCPLFWTWSPRADRQWAEYILPVKSHDGFRKQFFFIFLYILYVYIYFYIFLYIFIYFIYIFICCFFKYYIYFVLYIHI